MTPLLDKVQKALDQEGRWSVHDVARAIEERRAFPWCKGESVIIAEVRPYRERSEVNCWVVAGELGECLEILPEVEAWGRRIGASHICGGGRPGFARIMRKLPGWKLRSVVYAKELEAA